MELLHPRLLTEEVTKSTYDDTVTADECITMCDYRQVLVVNL